MEENLTTIALDDAQKRVVKGPPDIPGQVEFLKNSVHEQDSRLRALDTELQMRPALAFGCFFFVLIGCPVGIWFSRSDYLSAFITCFIPIVIVYYPLVLCGTS